MIFNVLLTLLWLSGAIYVFAMLRAARAKGQSPRAAAPTRGPTRSQSPPVRPTGLSPVGCAGGGEALLTLLAVFER